MGGELLTRLRCFGCSDIRSSISLVDNVACKPIVLLFPGVVERVG